MLRKDALQVGGDAGQRCVEADRLQRAARITPQGVQHAIRIVMEFVEVASLDAAVPVIHGVVDVADDVDDAALLDRDFQAASCVAETADGSRFNHGVLRRVQGGRAVRREAHRPSPSEMGRQNLKVKSTP